MPQTITTVRILNSKSEVIMTFPANGMILPKKKEVFTVTSEGHTNRTSYKVIGIEKRFMLGSQSVTELVDITVSASTEKLKAEKQVANDNPGN